MKFRLSIPWLVLVLLCMFSCNQKDPKDVSQDYFPLIDGASWTYLHSSKGGWQETVEVKKGYGKNEFIFDDIETENPEGESSLSTVIQKGTAVFRTEKINFVDSILDFSVEYTGPGFLRFDNSWLQKETPFDEVHKYFRTEIEDDIAKKTKDRTHLFTIESLTDEVKVEGGTFRNCVRVRRQRLKQLDSSSDDNTDRLTSDEEGKLFWFAPGVGKVKEQNLDNDNTEILIDYTIPED